MSATMGVLLMKADATITGINMRTYRQQNMPGMTNVTHDLWQLLRSPSRKFTHTAPPPFGREALSKTSCLSDKAVGMPGL